jgi:O-antigen/teichoic acid export membrane protein
VAERVSYRRAMFMVTASSLLVPVIGLVTAPLLAHSLGVAGRGEAGAALAPNLLIAGVATIGLPQALTFHLAKRPHLSRPALAWAALFTTLVGAIGLTAVLFTAPVLSAHDAGLERLMIIGTVLVIPTLFVGLLRGAAGGRQMWTAIAAERIFNSVLRLIALVVLAGFHQLHVTNALIVMAVAPIVAGAVYFRLLGKPPTAPLPDPDTVRLAPLLLTFGSRVWLGSVATMVIAQLSQLLITPLAGVAQLGLYLVANTISDIPYIVTQTIRDVAFGANSAESDTERLASTSRVATLIAFAGSAVIGVTLPLWIGILFGQGFVAAILPTELLLLSSVAAVPGLIAGAALDSNGRPGLKSIALSLALIVNLAGIFALTPVLGATGAAMAGLVSTVASTAVTLIASARVLSIRWGDFVLPRRVDFVTIWAIVTLLLRKLPRRRANTEGQSP